MIDRRSYFEVFWYSHHLFIVFFVGLMVHGAGEVLRYQTNLDKHNPEYCFDHLKEWGEKSSKKCEKLPTFGSSGPQVRWNGIYSGIYSCFHSFIWCYNNTDNLSIIHFEFICYNYNSFVRSCSHFSYSYFSI